MLDSIFRRGVTVRGEGGRGGGSGLIGPTFGDPRSLGRRERRVLLGDPSRRTPETVVISGHTVHCESISHFELAITKASFESQSVSDTRLDISPRTTQKGCINSTAQRNITDPGHHTKGYPQCACINGALTDVEVVCEVEVVCLDAVLHELPRARCVKRS